MKAGAVAQLARKPHVKPTGGRYRFIDEPEARGSDRCRISQAVEIIGDREVFGDVAFPWSDDAAPGLRPAFHCTLPTPQTLSSLPAEFARQRRSSASRSHRPRSAAAS